MSIRKYISLTIGTLSLVCALSGVSTNALAGWKGSSFIQLASNTTAVVTADQVNKPQPANLDSQDRIAGKALSWSKAEPNIITINEDGSYFLMFVAQVGAKRGAPYQGADIFIWNTLNGKPLAESSAGISSSPTAEGKTIVSQDALVLKKGDKLGFMYTASSENAGLITRSTPTDIPSAGALTVTLFKID